MEPVYIKGTGMVAACKQEKRELLAALLAPKEGFETGGRVEFRSSLPPSKLRRCSRYTKMAAECAALAIGERKEMYSDTTGTIISTGYGAVENNIAFADSVVKKDPNLCSPSVFSGTVPNSCVGQICIINGFKGFSTILTAGDPLEYSALLLGSGREEYILCGAVEEYHEDLKAALVKQGILDEEVISEGAAMVMLSGRQTEDTCCKVTGFYSHSFGTYPYISQIDSQKGTEELTGLFEEIASLHTPDLILSQANGSYFDRIEKEALRRVWGGERKVKNPKSFLGEALGAGYMQNVVLGALLLEEAKSRNIKKILATGMDCHGTYMTAILEGNE